ncbi:MAG: P-loop NTPase fold protein, partial [bacterium]
MEQYSTESFRLFKDTSYDETSNEDWLSKSLTELIKNSPHHYRLGVTRPLGTGKSTLIKKVIENLEKEYTQEEKSFKAITIDVWNLDKDSARRSTIYRLCKSLSF